jgi:hypothetical protein
MDKLYAKLSEQHSMMQQQKEVQKAGDDEGMYTRGFDHKSSCSSLPLTPAIEGFPPTAMPTARSASATPGEGQVNPEEILRLKLELAQAQNKISRLDHELSQTRVKPESDCGAPTLVPEQDFASVMAPVASPVASRFGAGSMALSAPIKTAPFSREHSWTTQDDVTPDMESMPAAGLNRPRGIWNSKPTFGTSFSQGQTMVDGAQPVPWGNNRVVNYEPTFASPGMDMYRQDRMVPDQDVMRPMGRRGNRYDNRYASSNTFGGGYNNYGMAPAPYETNQGYSTGPQAMMGGVIGMGQYSPYQQQPVGTALSPHATEFTSLGSTWKGEVSPDLACALNETLLTCSLRL